MNNHPAVCCACISLDCIRFLTVDVAGVRLGRSVGFSAGLPDFSVFLDYALAFWYGSTLARSGELDAGEIVIVMFSIMIAFMVRVIVAGTHGCLLNYSTLLVCSQFISMI